MNTPLPCRYSRLFRQALAKADPTPVTTPTVVGGINATLRTGYARPPVPSPVNPVHGTVGQKAHPDLFRKIVNIQHPSLPALSCPLSSVHAGGEWAAYGDRFLRPP